MRNIYIAVAAFLVLSILLFISSFIYLDKTKREVYHYIVSIDGKDVGAIKVERFETDEKIIYKSETDSPFSELATETRSRLTMTRKYGIEDYTRQALANRATDLVYLENKNAAVSYVSRRGADFACAENIPVKKDTFVFEYDSPATYMPMIENYDFHRGKAQGFNALSIMPDTRLPPMKRFVTFTSIKDEYIKIGRRKIKTENLLVKIKNQPTGGIWVAKSDRSIIKIEMPGKALTITRTFSPKKLKVKDLPAPAGYIQKEVTFKSKGVQLSGAVTVPEGRGRYPAVLLVCGDGAQDMDCRGLFYSIAGYLSKNGFCVLRFDRRGVGSSDGEAASSSYSEETDDVNAALDCLASQKESDPQKISIVVHSDGALYALKAASENASIKAVVLMAPEIYPDPESAERIEAAKSVAAMQKWPDDYIKLAARSIRQTKEIVNGSTRNWASVVGKRCFLRGMRERYAEKPAALIAQTKTGIMVLYGKEDEEVPLNLISALDKALSESGNPNHITSYYGYLGHFFGKMINDGVHRRRYEADGEVLGYIKGWLDKNMAEAAAKTTEQAPK